MIKKRKTTVFYLCSLLFLLSCKPATRIDTDSPALVAGTSTITGTIIIPNNINKDSILVTITVLHPISGENVRHDVLADQSGKFSTNFDMETESSFIGLYTNVNPYKTLMVKSINDGVTNIDIVYNSNRGIENIEVTPTMRQYDMRQSMGILSKMIDYRPDRAYPRLYDKSIDEFLNHAQNIVSERLGIFVDNDALLSKEVKEYLSKELRLFMYTGHVFDYEGQMKRNYRNVTRDTVNTPEIQKIDRSYFRFLKDFDLNDPQYLHTYTFPEFQNLILQNEILDIPKIGENDIPSWLASVKAILSDLVGFDEGLYYDILAANAYARQLNIELRPLSEKQKEQIAQYWENGEIAKILLRKNQQVVELDKVKSPTVVNDIPSLQADRVAETIVANYKDKVVFIDFWATWCAPCLDAMKQFRNIKGDFRDKDVVFVYLTDGSSPLNLWEEKIKGIGGEHYYLTDDQWTYMMEHFGFEGIPSYVLYDRKGVLIDKFTGFPGNDTVKGMIDGLLE